MEKYIITIDAGTSNTRAFLFDSKKRLLAEQKRSVGVRNTAIDGSNNRLKAAVRDCLLDLLAEKSTDFTRVEKIIASGMITSNLGLAEIPHITAPCGVKELAAANRELLLDDVSPVPICFIPGVKNFNAGSMEDLEFMDIMRGEETESCALAAGYASGKPMLFVLPGSHTKFASVDGQGRITGFLSAIGGELLAAITTNTILSDAVHSGYVKSGEYDKKAVLRGYDMAKKTGLSRACFSIRVMNLFINRSAAQAENFLLGAVLQTDLYALFHSGLTPGNEDTAIIIAGKPPFEQALKDCILHENSRLNVKCHPAGSIPLSAQGALLVADELGI